MAILNLNLLQANKTSIPFTLNSESIEWMKPFLIDHGRGVEGTQIRTASGDIFVVTETYQQMRDLMSAPMITEEVVPVGQVVTEVAPAPAPVTKAADKVFGGAASGIADPGALDK